MDAAVQDQLLQGQPGDLPADGVKAGDGEGMGGVWRLVEATLEVIEEYVPKKDAENNYVGEEREFDF